METSEVKKITKTVVKKSNSTVIRISNETKKKLMVELVKVNKKQFGKKVKLDALLSKLLLHLSMKDIGELQEESLTGRDRLQRNYKSYCSKFGDISMDQFLEIVSRETIQNMLSKSAEK